MYILMYTFNNDFDETIKKLGRFIVKQLQVKKVIFIFM